MASTLEELSAKLAQVEAALMIMEMDRDYWRRQHDFVMDDWKADCVRFEAELEQASAARPPATGSGPSAALLTLLRFYDPEMGAVHGQTDGVFLFDAFAQACAELRSN